MPRPVWEPTDPDGLLARGQLPALSKDAHRHQVVEDELLRKACSSDASSILSMFSEETQGNTRQSRCKPDAANMMQILQTRP